MADITFGDDMRTLRFGAWAQQVAGKPEGWMTYYKGLLDEVRIYNKALSETEIKALYAAEITVID